MKYIVIALLFSTAFASDLYVDAYRFDSVTHTGRIGLMGDHWQTEYSLESGAIGVGYRQYLEFQNIELGALFLLTNKHEQGGVDGRMVDIEGGFELMPQPYIKVGSELFGILKLDEANKAVFQVGFKLY